ncbi:Arabinanase/levansucrase/invertase [Rhizodiscina lignyota]|uniref:Arabinanase/levansucrase/invertase n=1 Tax=Rhizodiscina lignyota TaxID=1504668 RepID=A0A9P4IHQ1_9PEZI|nr:Arabinanase/levansucrase/invertase [Rhizodiscina lignyota]
MLSNIFFLLFLTLTVQARKWIVPGALWYDTTGAKIDAHGAGMWKVCSTYYLTGSSYASSMQPRTYSSTDLTNWVNRGIQFPIPNMFRPKMFYTGDRYWIFGQVNRTVQSLWSHTPIGGWHNGTDMLDPHNSTTNFGITDQGVFADTDGKVYYLASADHNNLQVNIIRPNGTVGEIIGDISGAYEAPGCFKVDGTYFIVTSNKTAYAPNPDKVFWATDLHGPWNGPQDIAPESTNTYNSQNTYDLVVEGSERTTYVYTGDEWTIEGDPRSNYVWLPMSVDGTNVTLQYHPIWRVDVRTGEISTPEPGRWYKAPRASPCNSPVTFTNVKGTGAMRWVSFYYTVSDPTAGDAQISINGAAAANISTYNSRAGYSEVVPVGLKLKRGRNSIEVSCTGYSNFTVSLKGIEVHDDY